MGQIVFSWDTFHNIPALEVWLKNLVCSFVFPILPLFYPNMVCEQLPNPIRIARKCLMCIKNLQYLSGFTYHLYLLTCFCYHSAMFAACEKSFVWGSVFTSFSILFFLIFWLLDKHSRRSNPFFFITKSEVWVVFMVCFFFKGRFWYISSILSDLFFCVFVCVCFWICFPEYLWFDVYNFVVPHHVPTKWPATFKRLRSWVVVDAYLCSSCCKTIWNTTVFMFSSFLPSQPAKWRDKSSSKRLQDGSALAFCHFLERIQW